MNEFDRIKYFFRPLAKSSGALELSDDAAILEPRPGYQLVLTTDAISEGVHFLKDDPPSDIARKLLRVNLSDLAAKGAVPVGYLLTLMLPHSIDDEWLNQFALGLAYDGDEFGIPLLGGDTVSTKGTPGFSITAIGEVPAGTMLRRAGAKAGDMVVLSGQIGEGTAGLFASTKKFKSISDIDAAYFIWRYRLPQPKLPAGQMLREIAHAGMDVSDGLLQDLNHMCNASGVAAEVEFDQLPLTAGIKKLWLAGDMTTEDIVAGGDDYELLLAVPPEKLEQVKSISEKTKTPLTVIGKFKQGTGVELLKNGNKVPVSRMGFNHF